jgi:nucleotide-binding universal stress UspA family protein
MSIASTPLILAACDGGDRGRHAVVLGRALAEHTNARLLIVAVYPHPGLPFPPPLGHREDDRRQADHAIRAVRDDLAPDASTAVVPGLSPAHAICEVAEARDASLIVVGCRAGHHIGDADHALQVLRSAHTDVLVVPDGRPVSPVVRRILVGFDGGPAAHDALARAIELARATGAAIRVLGIIPDEVHAWWLGGATVFDPDEMERWIQERQVSLSREAQDVLADAPDVTATCDVICANAVKELVKAAAGADLLVLGPRRWGPLTRLVLGSVSEPVARAGACPTLVVAHARAAIDLGERSPAAAARS